MATTRDSSNPTPGGSHYQPSIGVVLIILILFVGAAFVALRSHTPSRGSRPPTHNTTTTTGAVTTTTGGTTTPARSKVSVQVANGTTVTGLAGTYTSKLQVLGWNTLPRLNGPSETTTVIYYHPGFLWAAQAIATEIGVPATAAQPIGTAAPVPGATGDDIIVILGPDVQS